MRQFQTMSRGTEARDFNLLQDNASYVQTWSAAQCFIVMLCTIVQVRKKCSNDTPLLLSYVHGYHLYMAALGIYVNLFALICFSE
jgi:hypothetical protein